jgi:hypothetical protein
MQSKFLFAVRTKLLSRIYVNTNNDYRNTILLSSMGRSGSTLVSNIINYKNDYRIIFEPFKHNTVKIAKPFVYPSYISPHDENHKLLDPLHKIITGKIRTAWTDKDNKKIFAGKRLIKDVRTNMMLGWIRRNYPDLPIVLLIRNPFAVVESWMRAKWSPDIPKKRLLEQEANLSNILPTGILSEYRTAETAFENHLYNWCINYYIPLQKAEVNKIHLTFYESYLNHPEKELFSMFSYLSIPFNENALQVLNDFSRTTRKDSPLRKGLSDVTSWKANYTSSQIEKGYQILSKFAMDDLYDFNGTGLPLQNQLQ